MDNILLLLTVFFVVLLFVQRKQKQAKQLIFLIARLFVGFVFIYSGFVKAVDPLGFTYKLMDYFSAFGLPSLHDLAFYLSIALSSLEFMVGVSLFLGTFLNFGIVMSSLFMLFFTPLTLYLAFSNPVTDCGCFGDALVLTNWQTFWKNIVIDIPLIVLIMNLKRGNSSSSKGKSFFALALIFILGISIYGYRHLPILDFRPYKIGNNIAEGMKIPEGALSDVYENTFYYKNKSTGKEQAFSEKEISDIVNQLEVWEYVRTESVLIQEGYHPPIHDFKISNDEDGDITETVLSDTTFSYMLVSYDLKKADLDGFVAFEKLASSSNNRCICLTAALSKDIEALKKDLYKKLNYDSIEVVKEEKKTVYLYEKEGNVYEFEENNLPDEMEYTLIDVEEQVKTSVQKQIKPLSFKFYICDPITLKTIVRANPGLVLIKEGTIINKWHFNDFPKKEDLENAGQYISKKNLQ